MQRIFQSIWLKQLEIVQSPGGWLAGLGLFIVEALTGGKLVIYTVVIAAIIDLACGIAVSQKKKQFTLSELMRNTVEKLAVYGAVLLAFLCLDKVISADTTLDIAITSGLVGAVITMSEAWSFSASLLILFPKNSFLRLMQKALTGEIAKKLGCEPEEVEAILKSYRDKKVPARNSKGQFVSKKKGK